MNKKAEVLLQKLQDRIANAPRVKTIRIVVSTSIGMEPATRRSHIKMIRHLAKLFRLQVLVDQAVFGRQNLESLEDSELLSLRQDIERAKECFEQGIPLEDAGLVKPGWEVSDFA